MNKKHRPQKHGQFVPIGDIAFDLPGVPVKALSERAPQARHHFTTLRRPPLRSGPSGDAPGPLRHSRS